MPHVSVIVPNYNYSRYLRQRIDSILCQTYQDFELILLDDKSTDDSVSVLNTYSENPHVSHIVVNEKNSGGVFYQWERGLKLAKGDYIWIAEADDWAEPTFLEKCVGVLDGNQDAVLCQTGSTIVDSEGNPTGRNWDRFGNSDSKVLTFGGKEFTRKFLRFSNILYNASGIVFRKSAIGDFPHEVKNYKAAGDWIFWLLLAQKGSVAIVKERLNNFRKHGNSTSWATPLKENIMVFKFMHDIGLFKWKYSHSELIKEGAIQRQIKHLRGNEREQGFTEQLKDITHTSNKLPYHYSQFCKFMDYILPVCVYPPTRKF